MFAQEVFLLGTAWETLVLGLFSQPLLWIAYFSFNTSLYPPSNVHVQVQFSRADTCPINPYLKWLEVVVKTEKYCSVRRRVFNCSNGSLSFVLYRHIVQGSFLHQCEGVQFFLKLFLYRTCPFFQERFEMPRTKSSSIISLGHLDFHLCPRQCPSSARALGPNVKWAGVTSSLAPQQPLKILLSGPSDGEEGFGDVESMSRLAKPRPSSMSVPLHLLGTCSQL